MGFLRKIWSAIYHIWYYLVVFISIILILPFIYITTLKEDTHNNFFWWCRIWAKLVLRLMGYRWNANNLATLDPDKPYIIIGNHASELDIMMALVLVKNRFVFIGKAELAKMPLFGYFYKRTNILVNRNSISSKKQVLTKAAEKLKTGAGICIFPEGGIPTPDYLLAPFKAGAFKIAIESNVSILPITFINNKQHFGEFLDGGYPGKLKATIHQTIDTTGLTENDIPKLMDKCYAIIHDELVKNGQQGKTNYTQEKK